MEANQPAATLYERRELIFREYVLDPPVLSKEELVQWPSHVCCLRRPALGLNEDRRVARLTPPTRLQTRN
jgi:hypothetical protein